MSRARSIANFGDGIATADIDDGAITSGKLASGAITASALPAGSVLQVVQAVFTGTQESTTSTSYQDTSITASITPSSASNKIVIFITTQTNAGSSNHIALALKRNSTDVAGGINFHGASGDWLSASISYLDAPSSTSSVTYTLRFRSRTGGLVYNGWGSGSGSSTQNIILMEIAG